VLREKPRQMARLVVFGALCPCYPVYQWNPNYLNSAIIVEKFSAHEKTQRGE
jgi:hypothetical protein